MKNPQQLRESLNEIINNIESCFDKLTDAMCDGRTWEERRYQDEISYLKQKKETLEWVLS